MTEYDVVIVGAGSAGIAASEELAGSRLSTCLISGEDRLPYKRTKISKHISAGFALDQFAVKPREWYGSDSVDLIYGDPVVQIDPHARTVRTASDRTIGWGSLILATGADARRLGDGSEKVFHVVHAAIDVEHMLEDDMAAERYLVVGAGVLGVEIVDQLVDMRKQVTLVSAGDRLMPIHLNERAAAILYSELEASGVQVYFSNPIDALRVEDTIVQVDLGGNTQEFDRIVAAIGITPSIAVAKQAGIETNVGIVVNERLETSVPGIYAAGDVAEHRGGIVTHLWHAAEHQGRIAAQNVLGADRSDVLIPCRLKCEVFDRYFFSVGFDDVAANDTEPIEDASTYYRCLYYAEDRLRAVVMVDDKDRAKLYERAVRERWPRGRVESELPA